MKIFGMDFYHVSNLWAFELRVSTFVPVLANNIASSLQFCHSVRSMWKNRKSEVFLFIYLLQKFILFSTSGDLLHWSMHIFCKNLAWPWNFCKQQRAYNCTYLLGYSVCYSMLNAVTIVAVISSYSNVYIWHVGFTSQILFTFQIFWLIYIFR